MLARTAQANRDWSPTPFTSRLPHLTGNSTRAERDTEVKTIPKIFPDALALCSFRDFQAAVRLGVQPGVPER
jgi:hypothetical protein